MADNQVECPLHKFSTLPKQGQATRLSNICFWEHKTKLMEICRACPLLPSGLPKKMRQNFFLKYLRSIFSEVGENKERLLAILKEVKQEGKKIAGYGAPAKGNTLLNYYRVGTSY